MGIFLYLTLLMLFSIASLNINGINNDSKWAGIFNTILSYPLLILFLQETHLTVNQEYLFWRCLLAYDVWFENGTSQSAGVLIAIKRNCRISARKLFTGQGRFLACEVEWQSSKFLLCNIYAPNEPLIRKFFFGELTGRLSAENVILGGDFNLIIDKSDRKSGKLDETSEQLGKIIHTLYLLEPKGSHQFTYQHPSLSECQSHLDRFYVSTPLWDDWYQTVRFYHLSDHQEVMLIPKKEVNHGLVQQQFANDALQDKDFDSAIRQTIVEIVHRDLPPTATWITIKASVQEKVQDFTKFWWHQHNSELKSLQKYLSWINSQIYNREESLDFDRE